MKPIAKRSMSKFIGIINIIFMCLFIIYKKIALYRGLPNIAKGGQFLQKMLTKEDTRTEKKN